VQGLAANSLALMSIYALWGSTAIIGKSEMFALKVNLAVLRKAWPQARWL
jgi:hypothetical protein